MYEVKTDALEESFDVLTRIDLTLHPMVEDGPLTAPPSSPDEGQCWVISATPSGDWAGQANCLAMWSDGGWRFVTPVLGMTIWHKQAACRQYWTGTDWSSVACVGSIRIGGEQVVGPRLPTIATPSSGTIIDAEGRAAIAAVIAALMSHGLIG